MRKTEYAPNKKINLKLITVIITLIISFYTLSLAVIAAAETSVNSAISNNFITLSAPDIKTGENLIKIGDTKYIRYSITINEYKTLFYQEISFNLEFDNTVLDLYTTNVNLQQIYAYDVTNGVAADTQNSIVWYEPELIGNKVNFSTYSTTGMWFRGPVIILYFLVREDASIGDVCSITMTDFKAQIINQDGSSANMSNILTNIKNGTVTVTENRNFNEGETIDHVADTSPFKGKGDSGLDTDTSGISNINAPLYYSIALLILIILSAIMLFGILKINKMLRYGNPPRNNNPYGGDTDDKSSDNPPPDK